MQVSKCMLHIKVKVKVKFQCLFLNTSDAMLFSSNCTFANMSEPCWYDDAGDILDYSEDQDDINFLGKLSSSGISSDQR